MIFKDFFKKQLWFIFFLIFTEATVFSYSQDVHVKGSGFGSGIKEAKKDALSDLSQQIRVQVDSAVTIQKRKKESSVSKSMFQSIETRSSLPLIGVSFSEPVKTGDQYLVYAELGSSRKDAYKKALIDTKKLILSHKKESLTGSASKKATHLEAMLPLLEKFSGFQAVAVWLQIKDIPEVSITKEEILTGLSELRKNSDTIDFAARVIAEKLLKSDGVKYKKIYPYPPVPSSSDEVTPFSRAFYNRILSRIDSVESPDISDIKTTGTYTINDDGIDLIYSAVDKTGNILATGFVRILPAAYKNYSPEPSVKDFSKLIKEGIIVSDRLNVDITTDRGKDHLLYKQGDQVKLFVRMSRPGYFYILVHNLKNQEYSYLIDFFEGKGKEKFIFRISPDMVNKWVDLGEFEVVPPFGIEKLEVFASTEYPGSNIPNTEYDKSTMLYRLSNSPEEAVTKTRGLVRKNRIKKKIESAEAVLTINTTSK